MLRTLTDQWPPRRVAAGALFFNDVDHLLIVKPTYRDGWLLPGGVVEADESPLAGCKREVLEELGLDVEMGRLLTIDHVSRTREHPEGFMFQFYGGVLESDDVDRIHLQAEELSQMEFVEREVALSRLIPRVSIRTQSSFRALAEGTTLYLEHGQNIP